MSSEKKGGTISVRDTIEMVLSREDFFGFAAVDHLRTSARNTDERFQALLRSDVSIGSDDAPWWRRGVLRYAGEQYAEDVRRSYGIEIEVR